MSNNLIRRIYEVPRKFLVKIIGYLFLPLLCLFIFFIHVGIFYNAYLHINIFESHEIYSALGKEERNKELKAITMVLCVIVYWLWQGIKLLFSKKKMLT